MKVQKWFYRRPTVLAGIFQDLTVTMLFFPFATKTIQVSGRKKVPHMYWACYTHEVKHRIYIFLGIFKYFNNA